MSVDCDKWIMIDITQQMLNLYENCAPSTHFDSVVTGDQSSKLVKSYCISTAKNGVGSQEGSECTPLGKHIIAQKIGGGAPINSVFVGRVATGEVYDRNLGMQYPKRDWILSRIMWLEGCEQGVNKGENKYGNCDTYQRYIYIHGTPDTEPMGVALSHGCIRMRNEDIIELYDLIDEGAVVKIIQTSTTQI